MSYLELVIGKGVEGEVHAGALSHLLDHDLKLRGAGVADVVIAQGRERLQQECTLGGSAARHKYLP